MAKSRIRFRPAETTWPGRPWEHKCLAPACADDIFAHTWHLSWWHAMGRMRAHREEKH